jgi:hypothetical protein
VEALGGVDAQTLWRLRVLGFFFLDLRANGSSETLRDTPLGIYKAKTLTGRPGDPSYSTDWFHTGLYYSAKSVDLVQIPRPTRLHLGGSTTPGGWISLCYSTLNLGHFLQLDWILQFEKVLNSRLRASCHVSFSFSQDFTGLFDEDFRLTLSLNCQFELRLKGYIHMGCNFSNHIPM